MVSDIRELSFIDVLITSYDGIGAKLKLYVRAMVVAVGLGLLLEFIFAVSSQVTVLWVAGAILAVVVVPPTVRYLWLHTPEILRAPLAPHFMSSYMNGTMGISENVIEHIVALKVAQNAQEKALVTQEQVLRLEVKIQELLDELVSIQEEPTKRRRRARTVYRPRAGRREQPSYGRSYPPY
jgi:hypothetical protein